MTTRIENGVTYGIKEDDGTYTLYRTDNHKPFYMVHLESIMRFCLFNYLLCDSDWKDVTFKTEGRLNKGEFNDIIITIYFDKKPFKSIHYRQYVVDEFDISSDELLEDTTVIEVKDGNYNVGAFVGKEYDFSEFTPYLGHADALLYKRAQHVLVDVLNEYRNSHKE